LAAISAAADPARYHAHLAAGLQPHRVSKVYYAAIPRERLLAMRDQARAQGQDFIPGGDEATIPVEEMGIPMAEITTMIRLSDAEFEAKQRSMRAHATQLPADSPFTQATPEELRSFLGTETLVLAPPPVSDRAYPARESDIFAGLEGS
jgi:hypothetical protein